VGVGVRVLVRMRVRGAVEVEHARGGVVRVRAVDGGHARARAGAREGVVVVRYVREAVRVAVARVDAVHVHEVVRGEMVVRRARVLHAPGVSLVRPHVAAACVREWIEARCLVAA
jgi:hypothetical protein